MGANAAAESLLKKLEGHIPDDYTMDALADLRARLALMPMRQVLAKVPAESVKEKAEMIGISRNTYYSFMRGEIRPSRQLALKLESLTGIPAERFRGRR